MCFTLPGVQALDNYPDSQMKARAFGSNIMPHL